jgi:hypothetical protein
MEIALEALRNGHIGLNATSILLFFENVPVEILRWEKTFCCGKHSGYCRRGIG